MLNPSYTMEVLAEVSKPPFQLIQSAVEHRWSFATLHQPTEVTSDDEPPLRLAPREDTISIDGLLGQYDPKEVKITIFSKGTARVAQLLDLREFDVKMV